MIRARWTPCAGSGATPSETRVHDLSAFANYTRLMGKCPQCKKWLALMKRCARLPRHKAAAALCSEVSDV